jgi:TonB family protein
MLKAPQRASEDLREQLRQGRVNPPLAANPNNTTPELEQDLTADSRNTTDREGNNNYQRWLLKNPAVIEAMSREKLSQPEEMTIVGNYPRRACAAQITGTAFYAVTVNPQGVVSNPELIKSAGYPILDNQAQIDISSRFFPNNSGQIKPYRVAVSYKPSPTVCPPAPKVNNPPVNTRVTPPASAPIVPVTPVKPQPVEKPVITPPEAEKPPIIPPQPEIPVEQTVKPQVPLDSPTPTLPPPEVTPPAPPVSRQPETITPPPAIEPPAPPSSKKLEAPNPETATETPNPEN